MCNKIEIIDGLVPRIVEGETVRPFDNIEAARENIRARGFVLVVPRKPIPGYGSIEIWERKPRSA